MSEKPTASVHSLYSSYREMLIEHLFAGEVMRHLWRQGNVRMEVLKPQVDDGGYDLVLEAKDIVRHVQLKASHSGAATHHVNVSLALARRPSGCVIWCLFNETSMELGPFLWFGGKPGEKLPSIQHYKVATHPKRNAQGIKGERLNLRSVPRSAFIKVGSIGDVTMELFGTKGKSSAGIEAAFGP